jgi:hypothetical protein
MELVKEIKKGEYYKVTDNGKTYILQQNIRGITLRDKNTVNHKGLTYSISNMHIGKAVYASPEEIKWLNHCHDVKIVPFSKFVKNNIIEIW